MMMNIDDVENFPFSLRSCSQELDVLLKKYKLERASSNVSIPHCFLDGFVKQFRWPYGPIRVHYRTKNVGMQAQWIENWFPSSLDEFAFVVEDDVVVSIHWYQYIKRALSVYYYGKDGERFRQGRERIIGISTQRPQLSLGRDEKARVYNMKIVNNNDPFLYTSVGTWGQLFFPRPWIQFRLWLDYAHNDSERAPNIPGVGHSLLRTTTWWKELGNKIWTPWIIKFMVKRSFSNVYFNHNKAFYLSSSYQELGVNYKETKGKDANLVENSRQLSWNFPDLKELQIIDSCYTARVQPTTYSIQQKALYTTIKQIPTSFWKSNAQYSNTIILVYGADDLSHLPVVMNWKCTAETHAISNYIFITSSKSLRDEILRRGISVIYVNTDNSNSNMNLIPNDNLVYNYSIVSKFFAKKAVDLNNLDLLYFDGLATVSFYASFDSNSKFQKQHLILDKLIMEIISNEFHVMTSRVDSVWKRNPFNLISEYYKDSDAQIFLSTDYQFTFFRYDPNLFTQLQSLKNPLIQSIIESSDFRVSYLSKNVSVSSDSHVILTNNDGLNVNTLMRIYDAMNVNEVHSKDMMCKRIGCFSKEFRKKAQENFLAQINN